jgi:hypothetical protein
LPARRIKSGVSIQRIGCADFRLIALQLSIAPKEMFKKHLFSFAF